MCCAAITFDEWRQQRDRGGLAATGGKIQADLVEFVAQGTAAILRLGSGWNKIIDEWRWKYMKTSGHVPLVDIAGTVSTL